MMGRFAVSKETVVSQQKWLGDREQCWCWNSRYIRLLFTPWPCFWKVGVDKKKYVYHKKYWNK